MSQIQELPHNKEPISVVTRFTKRAMDIFGASFGIVLLAPAFVVIGVAIKLDSAGPVFFRQTRVGRHGRVFRIYKFRSMRVAPAQSGTLITTLEDARITRVGAFVRKYKLDELPQLLNVLRGEMSLVGPRPEVPDFMSYYSTHQREIILSVRPGVTDYASIYFRNESSLLDPHCDPISTYCRDIMPVKFIHYERYTREVSVLTDLKIIALTIWVLLSNRSAERRVEHAVPNKG